MSYPLVSCHMSSNVSCPSQQLNSSTAHLSISVLSFEIFWDQCPRTDQKERRGRRGRRRRRRRRRRRKNQNDFSLLSSAIITTAAARVRRTAINVVQLMSVKTCQNVRTYSMYPVKILWTSGRYKAFHTTTIPLLFPGKLWKKAKSCQQRVRRSYKEA